MPRAGRQFEEAVYDFVKRLGDQSAKVYFDHKVPDQDTGTMRQVDAWVETHLMGHYPVAALISCKDWKSPLDIDDIGCLRDQMRSTGASVAIVYSRSGFTEPALQKARRNRISCCRLYENQPADVPDVLMFTSYCAVPMIRSGAQGKWTAVPAATWGDLFERTILTETGETRQLADRLAELIDGLQRAGMSQMPNHFPQAQGISWQLVSEPDGLDVTVHFQCEWKCYRGRLEANQIAGSYNLTDAQFVGSQTGPVIDTWSSHPGPGWDEVDPAVEPIALNRVVAIVYNGVERYRERLVACLAHTPLLPVQ